MINSLHFENFKSWENTGRLRFAPLTGFFGTNSSGKTALAQFLLMQKQTVESPDRTQVLHLGDERSLVELGTYQDVVFRHEKDRPIKWRLDWRRDKPIKVQDPNPRKTRKELLFEGRELAFEATVSSTEGQLLVEAFRYHLDSATFSLEKQPEKQDHYGLRHSGSTSFEFKRTQGRAWPLPAPVKCYGFPDQVRAYFQNAGFLSDLELAYEELFTNVFYLGPLRDYPRRQYTWAGAKPADMGRRGERAVDAILASRQSGVKISRGRGRRKLSVEEYVAQWLRELQLIHSFNVKEVTPGSNLYQVRIERSKGAPEALITDVGFGVSQILPVLVLCYYVPEGATVILEQPEIHLHPSVQAGLADVFIDAIQKRGIQIILESHSEYLLHRLQRRIAEENDFEPEHAALYFCSVEKGVSKIEPLDLDPYGNITNWPQDFFGDEMADIAARTKAAMERKKKAAAG